MVISASAYSLICFLATLVLANGTTWFGLKMGYSPTRCLIQTTIIILGCLVLSGWGYRWWFQQDLWNLWQQAFEVNLKSSILLYKELGWEDAELQKAGVWLRRLFLDGMSGWIIVSSGLASLVMYLMQLRLSPGLLGSKLNNISFSRWQAADNMIWVLMAGMLAFTLGLRFGQPLELISWNALIVLGSYYFLFGVSNLAFFLESRRIPGGLKILAGGILIFFPGLWAFLIGLGIMDTWWDWRRLHQPPAPKKDQ